MSPGAARLLDGVSPITQANSTQARRNAQRVRLFTLEGVCGGVALRMVT
jgi:hypothetical protein